MVKCDFSGYATRNDLLCGDGRTIRKDAFKENDGCEVPLVWNHEHNDPNAVLGHAVLENREDGVYAYGVFNDTEQGQTAKKLVQNGDVRSLSIWANQLKHIGKDVIHGNIRELSLVLAGANPGAYVDFIMAHSADGGEELEASWDENIMLYHSADVEETKGDSKVAEETKNEETKPEESKSGDKRIQDILNTLNEEQTDAVAAVIGMALEENGEEDGSDDEEGGKVVKHNVFDKEDTKQSTVLSHSDEQKIISMAKQSNIGSLRQAMEIFAEENAGTLAHGVFDNEVEALFPEYELLKKGEPEEKVSEIQGDHRFFQCSQCCQDETWDAVQPVADMIAAMGEGTMVPDELIPRCPHCGAEMFPWVRGYGNFLQGKKYEEEYEKISKYIQKNKDRKILLIELGVGRMTPMFIQEPFWELTNSLKDAYYISVNSEYQFLPEFIEDKGIAILGDIGTVLKDLRKAKEESAFV